MSGEYIWGVGPTWARRHLAVEMTGGDAPGMAGRAACGRNVMDLVRAQHLWEIGHPYTPAPKLDEIRPCDICIRVTGVFIPPRRVEVVPQTVSAYARRASAAETEVLRDEALFREVMDAFASDHDLTGRSQKHPECKVCRLLKRIRRRLASPDRVGVGT